MRLLQALATFGVRQTHVRDVKLSGHTPFHTAHDPPSPSDCCPSFINELPLLLLAEFYGISSSECEWQKS